MASVDCVSGRREERLEGKRAERVGVSRKKVFPRKYRRNLAEINFISSAIVIRISSVRM